MPSNVPVHERAGSQNEINLRYMIFCVPGMREKIKCKIIEIIR